MDSAFIIIKEKIDAINKKLKLPERSLPAYGSNESHKSKFSYVSYIYDEYRLINIDDWRGAESEIIRTTNIDELIFAFFKNATISKSWDYELNNRVPNQDPRIITFKKHIEILESLGFVKKYIDPLKNEYNLLINQQLFST